jgi:hypothetical protein
MKFVNLTPHDVIWVREDAINQFVKSAGNQEKLKKMELEGLVRIFPKTSKLARVQTKAKKVRVVDGIEFVSQEYGKIEDLPKPEKDTIYIVSLVVKQAVQKLGRTDVVSPDTSPEGAVRDGQGRIIGVKRFSI